MIRAQLPFVLSCVALVAVIVLPHLATDPLETKFLAGLVGLALLEGIVRVFRQRHQLAGEQYQHGLAKISRVFSIPVWIFTLLLLLKPGVWVWAIACIAGAVTAVVIARRWTVLAPSLRTELRARGLQ